MDGRTKVARACNILAAEGHMDTIYGHVGARIEGTDQVWMKPHTLGSISIGNSNGIFAQAPRERNPRKRPWGIPAPPAGGPRALAAIRE